MPPQDTLQCNHPSTAVIAAECPPHSNALHEPVMCAASDDSTDKRIECHQEPQASSTTMPKSCLNDNPSSSANKGKSKKRLRWSTVTIHEFGVDVGRSSVSDKGGPSIGLSEKPEFTWSTRVGEMAVCSEGVHRFTPKERFRLLQAAGVSEGIILRFAREANIILHSRKRTLEEEKVEQEAQRKEKKRARVMLDRASCSSCIRRPPMIPAGFV